MNRSSFTVKAARLFQKLPLSIFQFLEWPFLLFGKNKKENMIILIAPPRSGSTLTYQLLCHSFNSYYLSNLSHLLYKLPLLGGWLSGYLCKNYSSDFNSEQGFVKGLCGPAEGMHFWSYWFNSGLNEIENNNDFSIDSQEKHYLYIKSVFKRLGKPEKPIITGYLGHLICIERLKESFPNAIFVKLYRDPIANGLSILASKRKSNSEWFSVYPKECDFIHADEHSQVASQVYWLNNKMNHLSGDRVISIRYEDICANPAKIINKISNFCNERGLKLEVKSKLPNNFNRKKINPDNDFESLSQAFEKIENKNEQLNH